MKEGYLMNDKNTCNNLKPTFNGILICSIVKKPISTKCSECGKSCPNFEH